MSIIFHPDQEILKFSFRSRPISTPVTGFSTRRPCLLLDLLEVERTFQSRPYSKTFTTRGKSQPMPKCLAFRNPSTPGKPSWVNWTIVDLCTIRTQFLSRASRYLLKGDIYFVIFWLLFFQFYFLCGIRSNILRSRVNGQTSTPSILTTSLIHLMFFAF